MMAKTEQLRECNVELREGLLEFADRIRPPPSSTNQEPATKVPCLARAYLSRARCVSSHTCTRMSRRACRERGVSSAMTSRNTLR
jgi:hypothetical protein